jgi:hypothetical protein
LANKIYVPNEIVGRFETLEQPQRGQVFAAVDALEGGVIENSQFVSNKGPARGELRVTPAGNLRILFQYTPENGSIIITDVLSRSEADETIAAYA